MSAVSVLRFICARKARNEVVRRRRLRLVSFRPGGLLLLLATSCAATTWRSGEEIELRNHQVVRRLSVQGGALRTTLVKDLVRRRSLTLDSEGFLLRMMDGTTVTTKDFRVVRIDVPEGYTNHDSVDVQLRSRKGITVTVRYWLKQGQPFLWKRLQVRSPAVVDRVEVERFHFAGKAEGGGKGQPVYLRGQWFCGLEYPAGFNEVSRGVVALAHYPGRRTFTSKTAVLGTGPGSIDDAFFAYLSAVRLPPRNFLQYNSWYDVRGREMTNQAFITKFDLFKRKLLDPYGLKMDAFVPDDGWQNRNSIWEFNKSFLPDEYRPLAKHLEANGSRLGIWMPLNGTNLNVEWGRQRGYEVSNKGRFYCLVGRKYNSAIREATTRIIRDHNLAYYKHDFNSLRCTAKGHGHLPDDRHGHEASVDAELELLAYERRLQPDIFLNVTSGMWLSPWWLLHADAIWMAASDFGFEKRWPNWSRREWAMAYRDEHLFRKYRVQKVKCPLSALMTHGIILGNRNRLGGKDETLSQWSDYVVMYFGRGVLLKELYLSPELLSDEYWDVVGRAIQWAEDNTKTFEYTRIVGGEPVKGQPYGYVHWSQRKGIFVFRNPRPGAETMPVGLDERPGFLKPLGEKWAARIVYPCVERLPGTLDSRRSLSVTLPGYSVMVVEVIPESALPRELPAGVRCAVTRTRKGARLTPYRLPRGDLSPTGECTVKTEGGAAVLTAKVHLPDASVARADLLVIVRGQGSLPTLRAALVNGKKVTTTAVTGSGWRMIRVPLEVAVAPLSVRLEFTAKTLIWSQTATTEVWAECLTKLTAGKPIPATNPSLIRTPRPDRPGLARTSRRLLPETAVRFGGAAGTRLTEADLKTIRAAKLRLEVFDVNGKQYADKYILLNGKRLARVPESRNPINQWQERVVDIPHDRLADLRLDNVVQLTDETGDMYKFRGVALAVQLADGRWAATTPDPTVYCSHVNTWLYGEGKPFVKGKSPALHVVLPH